MTPSPSFDHQDVVSAIDRHLRDHVQAEGVGRVGLSPLDVHLPSGDVVQSDVFFVAASREGICQEWVHGAPDLVVEVLSPSRPERDRFVKRVLYEQNEVTEYWIVDLEERTVEVLHLEDGAYAPAGFFAHDQTLVSRVLEGLVLPLAHVFQRQLR